MLFARSCLGKRSSGKRWIHGRRSTAVSYPVTSLYSVALSSSSGDSCAFWWSSSHRDAGRPHLIRRRRCAGNFTWCATTYGRPCNPRGPETAGHWHLALSSYESAEKNIRGYCAKTTGKRGYRYYCRCQDQCASFSSVSIIGDIIWPARAPSWLLLGACASCMARPCARALLGPNSLVQFARCM